MKRNSKGFTLIELLAAVVILSILVGISLPAIINAFDNTKDKMYVSDARKLISLAEYQIKANDSKIEKPDEGDSIIISMNYLDTADFDNPPNGGKYDKVSSYVLVKNNKGNLEYSVSTVEKLKKGGFKGVELIKKSNLIQRNATSYVVPFKKVLTVDDVNTGYINEKLGEGYMSGDEKISAIYNYLDIIDRSSTVVLSGYPVIDAAIYSNDSTYYNSLNAQIKMKLKDQDNNPEDLRIYLSINGGYDDAVLLGPNDYRYADGVFFYDLDLANDYGMRYDGEGIEAFIVVKDPDGHEAKRKLTYIVHNNDTPKIDDASSLTRRDKDVYHDVPLNMLSAKFKLIVSDDVDSNAQLEVCVAESTTKDGAKECKNYRKYYDYFSTEGTVEYLFKCGGTSNTNCKRDGSTHYLTAFVKDTYGKVRKKTFTYTFSKNEPPVIESFSIESMHERFTTTGSKRIIVNLSVTDDVDDVRENGRIEVRVSDGAATGFSQYDKDNPVVRYTINHGYYGQTINLKIYTVDSEDGISEAKTYSYTMYKNKAPKINSFSIESDGTACRNSSLCPVELGGSKTVRVDLDFEDDINDDVYVCYTTVKDSCKGADYKLSSTVKKYKMEAHDGSTQIVYAYIQDDYGLSDSAQSEPYLLYINQPPVLEYAVFNSRTDRRPLSGSLYTTFNISALDDVDDSDLKFQIIEDGNVTLDANVNDYMNKNRNITLAGKHDGRQRNIVVRVYDTDGGDDSTEMTYDVYEGISPTIDLYNVYSSGLPCRDEDYCPSEGANNNNYVAKYIVKASDDIDEDNEMQVCVSESDTTCDTYTSYESYLENGTPKAMNYTFNVDPTKPYDGSVRTLYLYLKDRDQNLVKSSKRYVLYKNRKPVITEDPKIISNSLDSNVNFPDITYTIDAEDDIDENLQIMYCYKENGGEEICPIEYRNFEKSIVLNNDNFFHITRPTGQTYTIYSKIKDSYGEEVKSKELTYKVYTDKAPSIYQTNIVSGTRIYKNANGDIDTSLDNIVDPTGYNPYTRLKIRFSVDDPYDKYSVCISTNNSTCTLYQGTYDGNNCGSESCSNTRKSYTIEYDKPGFIEDGNLVKLYLFVKDSYNITNSVELFNDTYTECNDTNVEDATYVYEFDSELTNTTYGHTNSITMDRCGGKCYHYNSSDATINNVFAMYKQKITYPDKFNSGVTCNADNPEEIDYSASCDFKDCFYKNNNYNRNAIGTRLVIDEEPWTTTIREHIYTCSGHYNLYLSSYTEGNEKITLTKTNTKICNTALANGEYDYDSSSANPYVRVDD